MDDAGELDAGGAGRLAQADGTQTSPLVHLFVEGAHRLGQLAVNGVHDHRRQAALEGEQQSLETRVIVDDVEPPPVHRGVDPGQIGSLASGLSRPAEVVAPGGVGQHRDPRIRSLRAEHRDLMAHAAELGVEQMHHQLGASVAPRRQRVPGWRDERDP